MSPPNEKPTLPKLCTIASAVLLAALSTTLCSCSADTPEESAAQAVAGSTVSPFPRLTDPTGCVIEQITSRDQEEYQVKSASRDGRWLAMAANRPGASEDETIYEAYELDLATGEKTDLSHVLSNAGPYSPDNRFIVIAQETDNGKTDIFEYERTTGELHSVAPHEDWDWLPGYSPDGEFIVFNSYRVGGQSDIHLFEKSTGTLTRLTDEPEYEAHGQFSSDGQKILYHQQRGTRDDGGYLFDLMVYDIESGEKTRLTNGDFEEGYPAWAPDDRHIVFSSDVDGAPAKPNLYVLAPDGSIVTRLTKGVWKDSYAFWTHDGKYIYFNSDRDGVTNVYRMLMNGLECVMEKRSPAG